MPTWRSIWEAGLLWNTVGDWTLALIAFLVTLTVLPLIRGWIASRRRRWLAAERPLSAAIELPTLLIERTSRLFLFAVALYVAVLPVTLPPRLAHAINFVIVFIFWYQIARWAMAAVRFAIDQRRSTTMGQQDPTLAGSIQIILFVSGLVIWTLAFLLALDNLGIEVRPLLAGLGISGIAVALAVQAVLGDLLASMAIALDKPFAVGDMLAIEGLPNGTVEHIGVKSTRLRAISGEQIIMSNSEMLKSRVRNFGRMRERRIAFELTIIYDTPPDVLRAIPQAIREIIEARPDTRFDRCHLMTCGPTGLTYETVYFVVKPDFRTFADMQQAINIAILERFRELKVQFATPLLVPRPFDSAPAREELPARGSTGRASR